MADLVETWPTLTPRQRDARVAEALGWKHRPGSECPENALGGWYWPSGEYFGPSRPQFSGTWMWAGPLLDRLGELGWQTDLHRRPDGWRLHAFRPAEEGEDYFNCMAQVGPSVIALALCFARQKGAAHA